MRVPIRWVGVGALLVAAVWAGACSDRTGDLGPTPPAALRQPMRASGATILSSPACTHTANASWTQDVIASCVEIYGTGVTLSVNPPPATNAPIEFNCDGWGQAPTNEWVPVLSNAKSNGVWIHAVGTSTSNLNPPSLPSPPFASAKVTDTVNYVVSVTGLHPTVSGSPVQLSCSVDHGGNGINLTVNGPAPYVKSFSIGSSKLYVRPLQTQQAGVSKYTDDYNFDNQMVPAPVFTWQSSNPAVATVNSSTGLVTGVTRGTASITATTNNISHSLTFTVEACTNVAVSPTGPLTLTTGGSPATASATLTCDPDIDASSEPVAWATTDSNIVRVSGSGTGGHTGTITPVAAGTANVAVCSTVVPALCAPSIAVNVVKPFTTSITSPLDGSTHSVAPSASDTASFTVTNSGGLSGTATLTCSAALHMSCTGVSPATVTLAPGASAPVTVSYQTSSTTGSASLTLQSTGGGSDVIGYIVEGGPLSVTINYGPSSVRPNVNCEWSAVPNGGVPPYTWAWATSINPLKPLWAALPDTTADIYYVNSGKSFTLKATVTDNLGQVANATLPITVASSAPYCNL